MINPDMDAHAVHAEREQVWAEVCDWYKREIATDPELKLLLAMYDDLQLGWHDLLKAFRAMDPIKLAVICRLATAALCEVSYRHYCEARGDSDAK